MKSKILGTIVWNLVKLLPWHSWIELSLAYLDKKSKDSKNQIDDFVVLKLREFYLKLLKADVI